MAVAFSVADQIVLSVRNLLEINYIIKDRFSTTNVNAGIDKL